MKFPIGPAGLLAVALAVPSCGVDGTGSGLVASHPTGTGPFDSRGNYVEAWADDPSRWNAPSSRPAAEMPMLASVEEPPAVAAHEQPPMHSIPVVTTVTTTRVAPKPVAEVAKPKPKPVAKPKPQVAAKPKKPAPTRYTIRKGDSLYAIAKKHNSTVTAIQRANGIKGTLIHPGKTLVIPKY